MRVRHTYLAGASITALAALVAAWLYPWTGDTSRPAGAEAVMVGGEADLDACAAQGITLEVETPVRAGPGASFPQTDALPPGAPVSICGHSPDAAWMAVVYAPAEAPDADCGVATPIALRAPYAGPCRAGWVRARSVNPLAG